MNWGAKVYEDLDILVSCHNTKKYGLVLHTVVRDGGFKERILFTTGMSVRDLYDKLGKK